jgi:hypothetical protein
MDPIAVDIRLIKAVLGTELRIAPGRALMARVVNTDGHGRGVITIAGEPLEAALPEHIQAGQELKLVVREATPERVVLGLADQLPSPQAAEVPLPGGGSIRINEDDAPPPGPRGGAGARTGTHTLSLRYDAPALGPVDLRFELTPASLKLTAALAPGDPLHQAQARARELQEAVQAAVEQSVIVAVEPRHDPLDVYA